MAEEKHIHPQDYSRVSSAYVGPWRTVVEESSRYRQQQQISHDNPAKETWPEVVGLAVEEAASIIKQEKPGAEIEIVYPCHVTQQDLNYRRVKLFVDFSDKINETPTIG